MVYITQIHMSQRQSQSHEHIEKVWWSEAGTGKTGENTVAQMVEFIENQKGSAKVSDGKNTVDVGVVHPNSGAAFIRTYADGKWTDNLLALPRY